MGIRAEKERIKNRYWILKRLSWESMMNEEQISKKFGEKIDGMLSANIDNTTICKEIKPLINIGGI